MYHFINRFILKASRNNSILALDGGRLPSSARMWQRLRGQFRSANVLTLIYPVLLLMIASALLAPIPSTA